jgi:uncharacterized protein YjbJ (UPF0337 family)
MNWDTIESGWDQWKGTVKETWAVLTEDDLDYIAGRRSRLIEMLQKRYRIDRVTAEQELRWFEMGEALQCEDTVDYVRV